MKNSMIAIVALALGFLSGYLVYSPTSERVETYEADHEESPGEQRIPNLKRKAKTPAQDQLVKLQDGLNTERSKLSDITYVADLEKKRLATEVERLESELKTAREANAERNVAVSFGDLLEQSKLTRQDFVSGGEAIEGMQEILKRWRDERCETYGDTGRFYRLNNKLISIAFKLEGNAQTHFGVNGGFCHPLVMLNLMAAHLLSVGHPLTSTQVAKLSELGMEYEQRWNSTQARYTEDTFLLEKQLEEYELKLWCFEAVVNELTDDQRTIVRPEGPQLYSPVILFSSFPVDLNELDDEYPPGELEVMGENVEDLKARMMHMVKELAAWPSPSSEGLDLSTAAYIFDNWLDDLRMQIESPESEPYEDKIPACGRAQLTALKEIAANRGLTGKPFEKLKNLTTILVPGLGPEPE